MSGPTLSGAADLFDVTAFTASTPLVAGQCQGHPRVFKSTGATGAPSTRPLTLPSAAAGLHVIVINDSLEGVRVSAAAGDTIRIKGRTCATAGYMETYGVGNYVWLCATDSTQWEAITSFGTWSADAAQPLPTGLIAHYDASLTSTLTVDGSNRVSQWDDRSSQANHVVQAAGGNQPLLVADHFGTGLNAVQFDAARPDYLDKAAYTGGATTQPMTVIAAASSADASVRGTIISLADSAGAHYFTLQLDGVNTPPVMEWNTFDGTGAEAPGLYPFAVNRLSICCGLEFRDDGHRGYFNGRRGGENTTTRAPASIDRLSIGSRGIAARSTYLTGFVGEIMVWAAALSLQEVRDAHGYLAERWFRNQGVLV